MDMDEKELQTTPEAEQETALVTVEDELAEQETTEEEAAAPAEEVSEEEEEPLSVYERKAFGRYPLFAFSCMLVGYGSGMVLTGLAGVLGIYQSESALFPSIACAALGYWLGQRKCKRYIAQKEQAEQEKTAQQEET